MNYDKTFTIDSAQSPNQVRIKKSGRYCVEIIAEGASVDIRGGWHTEGKEKVDVSLDIIHRARHTRSQTLLRGVADGQSQIHLSGTIIIVAGAQDTNAFLTENILLLSDTASAQAIPNLEIEANEVKCSHAATVAKIPEEHLFYLQSRGLDRTSATNMIVDGFLSQTL